MTETMYNSEKPADIGQGGDDHHPSQAQSVMDLDRQVEGVFQPSYYRRGVCYLLKSK